MDAIQKTIIHNKMNDKSCISAQIASHYVTQVKNKIK